MLRPSFQGGMASIGQAVDPALDAIEPAIDIVQQDLAGVRIVRLEVANPSRASGHRRRTGECLLPISCHDRGARAAAGDRVATAALMFRHQPRALFRITARAYRGGCHQHLDIAGSVSWTDDAGFHTRSVSPFPGAKALSEQGALSSIGGGGAGSALAASILLPCGPPSVPGHRAAASPDRYSEDRE